MCEQRKSMAILYALFNKDLFLFLFLYYICLFTEPGHRHQTIVPDLPAGAHEYSFTFKLPNNIPSTFESQVRTLGDWYQDERHIIHRSIR